MRVDGNGTVDPTSGHYYVEGQRVQVVAIPGEAWKFDHWEDDASGNDPIRTVTMDAPKLVTAVFLEEERQPVATVEDFQQATWLVLPFSDVSVVTATAFGVGPQRLATNAHGVEAIKEVSTEPATRVGLFQHETGMCRGVTRVWSHPGYDAASPTITPDVGLLEVDDAIRSFVTPNTEAAKGLAVLDVVSLCGFPGSVTIAIDPGTAFTTEEFHPRATCLTGTVSAIRPFDPGVSVTPANSQLIQYDMPTGPGVSGSAVFDELGRMVGVHAIGVMPGEDFKFAIRSNRLVESMDWVSSGNLPGVLLADFVPATGTGTDSYNQTTTSPATVIRIATTGSTPLRPSSGQTPAIRPILRSPRTRRLASAACSKH